MPESFEEVRLFDNDDDAYTNSGPVNLFFDDDDDDVGRRAQQQLQHHHPLLLLLVGYCQPQTKQQQ
jgi:hypothetical protein